MRYLLLLLFFTNAAWAISSAIIPAAADRPVSKVNVTVQATPCFSSMVDAMNFAANTGNLCQANPGSYVCFTQLSTSAGQQTTTNTNTCPTGYTPLLSFGNDILNVNNVSEKMQYTGADTVGPLNSADQANWYINNNYSIVNYGSEICAGSQDRWSNNAAFQCGVGKGEITRGASDLTTAGANYPTPPTDATAGQYKSIGSYPYVEVTRVTNTAQDCFSSGCGQGCAAAYNSCGQPGICSAATLWGTYWRYTYQTCGYQKRATRPAGFYKKPDSAPPYSLPLADAKYSPTITICGKLFNVWKTPQVANDIAQTCNVDPAAPNIIKFGLDK